MLQSAWLFIGFVSIAITLLGLLTTDNALAMVCGAIGLVGWGIWTYGAFDVRVVSSGVTQSFTMTPVALFGLAMLMVPAWLLIKGPIGLASRYRDARAEEL